MAKIWPCRDGTVVSIGGSGGEISLNECEENLDVSPVDYLCDLSETPHFGNQNNPLAGNQHVVVEAGKAEAETYGRDWKPGFYRARVTPEEAYKRLGLRP
jgi:hypothetical protein